MKHCQLTICFLFSIMILPLVISCRIVEKEKHPNVLFIAVDDLRPELGCYGNQTVRSPAIDKLASQAVVFNRAYCQQAICMVSRASIMTGILPDKNNLYCCGSVDDAMPDVLTLNKFFKEKGYKTESMGKIYHHRIDYDKQFGDWIDGLNNPKWKHGSGPAYEALDVNDNDYKDGYNANIAVDSLKKYAKSKESFFLALGFHKPHLPFFAPKKYWDLYSKEAIKLPDNQHLPENYIEHTKYNFGELRNYDGIPKGYDPLSEELKINLKHGYYACVSYMDAQLEKVLNTLEETGLDKNTIVILWGDHGWKLGEHGMWCKHTNFELDTRVPFIIKAPGVKAAITDNFVELVDIYPTLVDLCGFEIPEHTEGKSLVKVMSKPDKLQYDKAFSLYPHNRGNKDKLVIGYTVRTEDYRYIEWIHLKSGKTEGRELYNHRLDPDENINIAAFKENAAICKKYSEMLKTKWKMEL